MCADRHIAPYAAEVDEQVRYPDEALRALQRGRPQAQSTSLRRMAGRWGDLVASCIVVEEVARVCIINDRHLQQA